MLIWSSQCLVKILSSEHNLICAISIMLFRTCFSILAESHLTTKKNIIIMSILSRRVGSKFTVWSLTCLVLLWALFPSVVYTIMNFLN